MKTLAIVLQVYIIPALIFVAFFIAVYYIIKKVKQKTYDNIVPAILYFNTFVLICSMVVYYLEPFVN